MSQYNYNDYSTFKCDEASEFTEYGETFNPVVTAHGFGLMKTLIGQN